MICVYRCAGPWRLAEYGTYLVGRRARFQALNICVKKWLRQLRCFNTFSSCCPNSDSLASDIAVILVYLRRQQLVLEHAEGDFGKPLVRIVQQGRLDYRMLSMVLDPLSSLTAGSSADEAETSVKDAVVQLLAVEAPAIRGVIRRYVGDESVVDDIFQDVSLKAVTRLDQLRERSRMRGWIFRVARNASLDWLRAQARRPNKTELAPDLDRDPAEWARNPIDRSVQRRTPAGDPRRLGSPARITARGLATAFTRRHGSRRHRRAPAD